MLDAPKWVLAALAAGLVAAACSNSSGGGGGGDGGADTRAKLLNEDIQCTPPARKQCNTLECACFQSCSSNAECGAGLCCRPVQDVLGMVCTSFRCPDSGTDDAAADSGGGDGGRD